MCLECQEKKMSRRNFLAFSTVAVAGVTLQTCGVKQSHPSKSIKRTRNYHISRFWDTVSQNLDMSFIFFYLDIPILFRNFGENGFVHPS